MDINYTNGPLLGDYHKPTIPVYKPAKVYAHKMSGWAMEPLTLNDGWIEVGSGISEIKFDSLDENDDLVPYAEYPKKSVQWSAPMQQTITWNDFSEDATYPIQKPQPVEEPDDGFTPGENCLF